jgi:hypothetical protein
MATRELGTIPSSHDCDMACLDGIRKRNAPHVANVNHQVMKYDMLCRTAVANPRDSFTSLLQDAIFYTSSSHHRKCATLREPNFI